MKNKLTKLTLMSVAIMVTLFSCSDEFTEQDLLKQQGDNDKALSAADSLEYAAYQDSLAWLTAASEAEYNQYIDSLVRADSIALANGLLISNPFALEVLIFNGSEYNVTNGRTAGFTNDVTVTISQYGVKQTATNTDGLFSFTQIGVGPVHVSVTSTDYTTAEFVIETDFTYAIWNQILTSGDVNIWHNEQFIAYLNKRSISIDMPIFQLTGANTSTLTGRAYIETDLTNRTKEPAANVNFTANIDVQDGNFVARFLNDGTTTGILMPDGVTYASIFAPTSWGYSGLTQAATDAAGDYSFTLPAAPVGLPIIVEYSDMIADKTYFLQTNGDVTSITRSNAYGPNQTYTSIPSISLAPTVAFFAGGGATATAIVSGNGSITDLGLTSGGQNYIGTPRVIIAPPSSGGTQATATAAVTNGVVSGLTLVDGGTGYTAAPAITITEGSGATASVSANIYDGTNGGVSDVIVSNAGVNYQSAPNVAFYLDNNPLNGVMDEVEIFNATNYPNGVTVGGITTFDFPAATATLNSGTVSVSDITVTNTGSNMGTTPLVGVTSGLGATATFDVVGGIITAGVITNGGTLYTDVPNVFTAGGAGGNGDAVFTITVTGGVVTAVVITNGGTGYVDGLGYALTFVPIGGGATGTAVWQGFSIGGVQVNNAGTQNPTDGLYYTTAPTVIFDNPGYQGTGSAIAQGTAVLGTDGRVTAVTVTNPGYGYTAFPAVSLLSGSGATSVAIFGNQALTAINVTGTGSGYVSAPSLIIEGVSNVGSGATAVANMTAGLITSIDITNAGTGYINGATIIVLDPGRSYDAESGSTYANPALAHAVVVNGAVASVDVYQSGDNYPTGTEVRVTSNKGNGFTASSTVANGEVTNVTVDTGGTGYVGNNYAQGSSATLFANPDNPAAPFSSGNLPFSAGYTGTNYSSMPGITRIDDVYYGTGRDRE